ncbi:hypothetical protein P355_3342 [Burkholderia cenocepacia KC-01]|nr:hypothetical protein P355_3342 [Burkholderia cenocepacia KC-01]
MRRAGACPPGDDLRHRDCRHIRAHFSMPEALAHARFDLFQQYLTVRPFATGFYDARPFVANGIVHGRREKTAVLQTRKGIVRIGVEGIQGFPRVHSARYAKERIDRPARSGGKAAATASESDFQAFGRPEASCATSTAATNRSGKNQRTADAGGIGGLRKPAAFRSPGRADCDGQSGLEGFG